MKKFVKKDFVLFLAFLLSGSSAGDCDCPDKFDKIDGRCVFVETAALDGRRPPWVWAEARKLCLSKCDHDDEWTTDLAAVDVDFLEAFTNYIEERIPEMKFYIFWVGASLVNGQWQWIDGSPISNTSYVWVIDTPKFRYEKANGMLVPAGAFNRFYMAEYGDGFYGPSYLCEATEKD